MIMDVRSVTTLTLLDLCTALDNLDHCDISFTNLLSAWYGSVLVWFVPYRSGREKKIKLLDCLASPAEVTCGVPQ